MTVVYLDQVFLLNLAVDYLLLLGTAHLAGAPLERRRFLGCAALGGLYAAAVFLPGMQALSSPLGKLLAGLFMSALAFWPLRRCWRQVALFFLLSGALGGLLLGVGLAVGSPGAVLRRLYYAHISWPVLIGTAAGMGLLLHLIFGQGARHGGGELMTVTVSIHQRQHRLPTLFDTGNTLRDPISGQPVLVAEASALEELWPPEMAAILKSTITPEEKMARLHHCGLGRGFSLLPFRSVGRSSGLLLAVRSDFVEVGGGKYPHTLVAIAEGKLSDGGAYQALWGGMERRGRREAVDAASKVACPTEQAG